MGYEEIEQEVDKVIARFERVSTVLPNSLLGWWYDIEWARKQRRWRETTVEEWERLENETQELFDELTTACEQVVTADEYDENRIEQLRETRDACLEITHSFQQLKDWYLYPDEWERKNQLLDRIGHYISLVEHTLRTAETRRLEFELARELETELDTIDQDLETHVSDCDPVSYSPETIEELRVNLQHVDERIEQLVTEVTSEPQYETLQAFQDATDVTFDELTLDPSAIEQHNSTEGLRERSRGIQSRLDLCELDHLLVVGRERLDEVDSMVEEQYERLGMVSTKREAIKDRLQDVGETVDRIQELTDQQSVRPAVDDLETQFANKQRRFETEQTFAAQLDAADRTLESFRTHLGESTTAEGIPAEYIARGDWEDLAELLHRAAGEYRQARECISEDTRRVQLLQSVVEDREEKLAHSRERLETHNTEFASEIGDTYPEVFVDDDGNELNNRQKEAVIANDSRLLVPAAAGTGKTKTVVHKINYLVNVEGVPAERILVAGFANASVDELNERISAPGVTAVTLHKLAGQVIDLIEPGQDIIQGRGKPGIEGTVRELLEKMLDDNSDYYSSSFEQNYLRLIKHMADEGTRGLSQVSSEETDGTPPGLQHVTFFLDKHRIEYTTDKLVTEDENDEGTDEYWADLYLPNYDIVISHIPIVDAPPESPEDPLTALAALEEHSDTPRVRGELSFGQVKATVEWEQQLFDEIEDIDLIYTYGWEAENNTLEEALERRLVEQFVVPVPSDRESYIEHKDKSFDGDDIDGVVRQKLAEGVEIARHRGLPPEDEDARPHHPTTVLNDDRMDTGQIAELYPDTTPLYRAFGDVLDRLYGEYCSYLRERNRLDFSHMLQRATEILCEYPDHKDFDRFRFDCIIIDEFQDISPTQMRFIATLLQLNTDAQLLCVGDDWQSIYAFRGGTSYYFLNFDRVFERPTNTVTLGKTYRNPQSVVDASIRLIENNEEQLSKDIQAASNERGVITIHESMQKTSSGDERMSRAVAILVERYIEGESGTANTTNPADIRVLVKNSEVGKTVRDALGERNIASAYNPDERFPGRVSVETPFNAKGKEAIHVVVYRALDNEYGSFPNVRSKDRLLNPIKQKEDNTFQEERRTFYVALTRASKTVDIFTAAEKDMQSRFIRELRPDFGNEGQTVSSHEKFERLLDHGIWDGEEPVLDETSLTGDTALELVEHAHTKTETGVPLFQLFTLLVTADSAPECESDELVAFYHWYAEKADETLAEREMEKSLEMSLRPFTEPVVAHNRAVTRAFRQRYREEPVSDLLEIIDAIRQQPLLDTPARPDEFDDILERYVFGTDLETRDCVTVASLLEQTATGLHGQPAEAEQLAGCATYLRQLESQYESLTITYPLCRSNVLRWHVPAIESVSALLLEDEQLTELRRLKRWSREPSQFDIVAAVSNEHESLPDGVQSVHVDVNPTQTS